MRLTRCLRINRIRLFSTSRKNDIKLKDTKKEKAKAYKFRKPKQKAIFMLMDKPNPDSLLTWQPGDWTCMRCNKPNVRTDSKCGHCQTSRPFNPCTKIDPGLIEAAMKQPKEKLTILLEHIGLPNNPSWPISKDILKHALINIAPLAQLENRWKPEKRTDIDIGLRTLIHNRVRRAFLDFLDGKGLSPSVKQSQDAIQLLARISPYAALLGLSFPEAVGSKASQGGRLLNDKIFAYFNYLVLQIGSNRGPWGGIHTSITDEDFSKKKPALKDSAAEELRVVKSPLPAKGSVLIEDERRRLEDERQTLEGERQRLEDERRMLAEERKNMMESMEQDKQTINKQWFVIAEERNDILAERKILREERSRLASANMTSEISSDANRHKSTGQDYTSESRIKEDENWREKRNWREEEPTRPPHKFHSPRPSIEKKAPLPTQSVAYVREVPENATEAGLQYVMSRYGVEANVKLTTGSSGEKSATVMWAGEIPDRVYEEPPEYLGEVLLVSTD